MYHDETMNTQSRYERFARRQHLHTADSGCPQEEPSQGSPAIAVVLRDVSIHREAEDTRQGCGTQGRDLYGEIVGASSALTCVLQQVEQVAVTDATVLITGETGTGKELVVRALHRCSPRKDRPLIKVNCTAMPAGLIESELFGHEKGAFTGAIARKLGRFELAAGGTLFLDEIGEMPLEMQAKLLRVLQEGEFERVGGTQTLSSNVRVVAATNRDLHQAVVTNAFRADLFYRLHVFPIHLPPLRERPDDIPLLVQHFVNMFMQRLGKRIEAIEPATMGRLMAYAWPGNIRELAHLIERALILTRGSTLVIDETLLMRAQLPRVDAPVSTLPDVHQPSFTLQEVERNYIVCTLEQTGWVVEGPNGAAGILGLHPNTLRGRMRRLGIVRPSLSSSREPGRLHHATPRSLPQTAPLDEPLWGVPNAACTSSVAALRA